MVNPINAANRDAFTRRSFVTVGALGTVTLAACSTSESTATSSEASSASATASPTPTAKFTGTVEVYPALDEVEINPIETVTVTTADSTLTKVTVTTAKGEELRRRASRRRKELGLNRPHALPQRLHRRVGS